VTQPVIGGWVLKPRKNAKREIPQKKKSFAPEITSDEPNEYHRAIFSLVRDQTQVDFSNYKLTTVSRRIQRQMQLHRIESLQDYAKYLESKPDAVRILCDDIFIHVTEFFRDLESFENLEKNIFPRLLKNKLASAPLRVWVPGCSTGQEAYSIAISLLEFSKTLKEKFSFQIFATDISEQAVQEARDGYYEENELKSVSLNLLKKYFDKTKDGYRIKRSVRELFVFSRHDLTVNPPFAKMDLISCRNVLIYFGPALQKQVIPVFHYSLNRDGILWLGKTESPTGITKLFTLIDTSHKVYCKINTPTPMTFKTPPMPRQAHNDIKSSDHERVLPPLDHQKELDRIILTRYGPAGLVVNTDFEIIQLRGDSSPYLAMSTGQPNYNLLKLIRPELLPGMRVALQTASKKSVTVRKAGLRYVFAKERRQVAIECL
jgi:two-component system CheB/CheR fusion protein